MNPGTVLHRPARCGLLLYMNTTANTFYVDHDGSVVCHHRDISCCPECATHPEIVEVYGVHYHVPDAAERAELLADIARTVLPEVK